MPTSERVPRTRPPAVLADKAHSSRTVRAELRRRGSSRSSRAAYQQGHRRRRGSRRARPFTYDVDAHRGRNVVERPFKVLKHWRGVATRYDELPIVDGDSDALAAVLAWACTV